MRAIDDIDVKLGHELADILWCVIVIAERCGIDLAASFAATMDEIEAALRAPRSWHGSSRPTAAAILQIVSSYEPRDYVCPLFAVIAGQDTALNAQSDVVFRDAATTALVCPKWWEAAPGHVLVVPNEHHENVYGIPDASLAAVYRPARLIAGAMKSACDCEGTSMSQHNEPGGGQDVWHFHVHVFPRWAGDRLNERNAETRLTTAEERAPLAERLRTTLRFTAEGR